MCALHLQECYNVPKIEEIETCVSIEEQKCVSIDVQTCQTIQEDVGSS